MIVSPLSWLPTLLVVVWACLVSPAPAQPAPRPASPKPQTVRSQEPPAEDSETTGSDRPVRLKEVTVTASPIIEGNEIDRYASQQTLVSESQLRDLNAQDLGTALRQTPGVNISRYNPVGSFGGGEGGAVFIRGMGSSRPGAEIKTLVDGVPMYMSVWNHPLLDLMSIDPAHSIEIYKSPQPQVFGNAFAVVNILPKRRKTEGYQTRAQLAVGSYETFVSTVEHGGKVDDLDYFVGGGYRSSDGHRSDSDGSMADLYANLGYRLSDRWALRFFTLWTDNQARDPGVKGTPPEKKNGLYKTRAWLATLTLSHAFDEASGSIKLYHTIGEGDWLDQPTSTPGVTEDLYNDFQFYGLKAREQLHLWKNGEIVAGLDADITEGDWDKEFSDGTRDRWSGHQFTILSPYVAVSHELGDREGLYLVPSAGLRYYDNSDFSSEWSPHAGVIIGYRDTELHFGYARGVVYPGLDVVVFSETVIPGLGDSWKDLRAERSDHFELGIRHRFDDVAEVDVTVFHDHGKDRYVFIPPPPPPPVYENIEDFTIKGIEATARVRPHSDVTFFAGMTFLDTSPSDLPYAPDTTLSGGVNWAFWKRFRLSLDGEYLSDMFVNSRARRQGAANTSKVDDYFLLNGKLSYLFTVEKWGLDGELFLAGENLTDTDYEYQAGYPMPGINGMIGATLTF